MKVKFWGARGSIPTPVSPTTIENKIRRALHGASGIDLSSDDAVNRYIATLPEAVRSTIGGNTPCIEIRAGNQLLILDARLRVATSRYGTDEGEIWQRTG